MIWFGNSYRDIRDVTMFRFVNRRKYIEQVFIDSNGNPHSIGKFKVLKRHIEVPSGTYQYSDRILNRQFILCKNDVVFEEIINDTWVKEVTDKNLIDEVIKCKDIM